MAWVWLECDAMLDRLACCVICAAAATTFASTTFVWALLSLFYPLDTRRSNAILRTLFFSSLSNVAGESNDGEDNEGG